MPSAAKGGDPLWKPHLGVRRLRICQAFLCPGAPGGMGIVTAQANKLADKT